MLKYIADITILAVEIICYLIFFGIFARGKKIKVKQKISAICLLISIVYVCVHFLKNYTIVKLLMIMLTMLIVIRFLYEISAIKTIILTLLIQGIIGVIDYIVIMIVTARYNNIDILEDSTDLIGVLVIIASRIILFLLLITVKRISVIKKKNVIDMSNKEWLQFLIFPIFTLITVIVMTNSMVTSYHEDIVNVYYVIAIVLIVLNMVVFHLINEILENSQRIREADVLKQQSIGQLELYNSLRKNYDIQRKRTHEYKNQIMCIDSLLKKKNYNKLEEYINSIFDKLDGQLDMVDTNNEVVNAVINAKYYEALQNDVLFILKINDLSHIKVSDEDIVTILSNLLDNAIEAAGQCDIDKKTVGIKLLYEDDVLSIAVSNSYKTEPEIMEDGYMRTIKDDKEAYVYAYTITLEKILTLITIGIMGVVLNRLVNIIIFLCTFMFLRRRTGGFHLETFGQCFIGTNFICVIIEACDFVWLKYMTLVMFLCMVSVLYIICVGTVNHPNLALNDGELMESKKRARIIVALEALLTIVLCIVGVDKTITGYMAMGINICALLLVMSKIQSRMNK